MSQKFSAMKEKRILSAKWSVMILEKIEARIHRFSSNHRLIINTFTRKNMVGMNGYDNAVCVSLSHSSISQSNFI